MKTLAHAYTLVEVVVASVIFMLSVTVMFSTIALTRRPVEDTGVQLQAALYSRKILDSFRSAVADATWDTGDLRPGGPRALPADDICPTCGGTYTVADVGGERRIILNVIY